MSRILQNRELQIVAKALSKHKREVAECLFEPLVQLAKWDSDIKTLGIEQVIERETRPPSDYLINFLRTGDNTWRSLYLGHMLEQIHLPGYDAEDCHALRCSVLNQEREGLLRLLSRLVDRDCLEVFDRRLQAIHEIGTRKIKDGCEARILLIGDCLIEHVVAFLTIPLLEHGISLRHEFAPSKNPVELRNSLRAFAESKFDIVFYSPYSNIVNQALYETHADPNFMRSRRKLLKISADAHQQTRLTLRSLGELFECTICVQNTNNIRHHNGKPSSLFKNWITRRQRTIAAREVNALLDRTLFEMNQELPRPIVKIDETQLRRQHGELALGKLYYESDKHHPSVIAQKLSVLYCEAILANKLLSTKKVVVIDLDDTVWKGTIGEGAVEHYAERQGILQDLKRRGVLLAIASRNDPRNVHWAGGVLQAEDFVAQQINWDTKPASVRRIASDLNLKLKDFVFIDDRADQRELVKSSIPEIQVLDATAESSWDMLRAWAVSLPEQSETDRTQLYLERKQRESFLKVETEEVDENALFAELGLKVDFHTAGRKELARVAELINRTNQFNTCGSRTSLQQVTEQSKSAEHLILVAHAEDKFGDMGVVSVMILDRAQGALTISTWVLSCRVFGYGIETAMLNYVRRLGKRLGHAAVYGQIVETSSNHPCREVYARNGFVRREPIWVSETVAVSDEPAWLEITAEGRE